MTNYRKYFVEKDANIFFILQFVVLQIHNSMNEHLKTYQKF